MDNNQKKQIIDLLIELNKKQHKNQITEYKPEEYKPEEYKPDCLDEELA